MHGGRSCPGSGAEDGDCVDLPECPRKFGDQNKAQEALLIIFFVI